ncbi:MAG: hypothetical protein ACRDUA_02635, partial [Micromonosporaceae bacterium]
MRTSLWMRIGVAVFAVAALVLGTLVTTAGGADAPERTGGTPPQSGGGDAGQAVSQQAGSEPEPKNSKKPPASKPPSDDSSASPAASTMQCGAAFKPEGDGESYQDALGREDKLLGGLDVARVYYTGAPKQWPGKLDTDGRPMIVSFKYQPKEILSGTHDAHLRKWFADAPTDRDTYWVYYHEPEDNIEKGDFSAADYRAAWRHLATLAD